MRWDTGGQTTRVVLVALAAGTQCCLAALGAGTAVVGARRLAMTDHRVSLSLQRVSARSVNGVLKVATMEAAPVGEDGTTPTERALQATVARAGTRTPEW